MGLSLADAAVRGTTSTTDIAERKQSLLQAGNTEGLISLNRSIFGGFSMKGKDDADDTDDADEDDESDEDEGDDDEDEDEDEDEGDKPDPKDSRIQELSAEAKKKRMRIKKQQERIAELEAENTRLKGKGKSKKDDDEDEDDSDSEEANRLKQENETLKQTLQKQTLKQEFTDLTSGTKAKFKFKNPRAAFRLLDLDDVEIDEDGDVDGLEDAIEALAKSEPYLLVDDEKDDEDDDEKPRRKTGQRTGGSRKRGNPNREALKKKYNINR